MKLIFDVTQQLTNVQLRIECRQYIAGGYLQPPVPQLSGKQHPKTYRDILGNRCTPVVLLEEGMIFEDRPGLDAPEWPAWGQINIKKELYQASQRRRHS